MRKTIIYSIIGAACVMASNNADAQKYAVKAYGDIGLGKAMSISAGLPGMTDKSSANAFGVDFGYTFWRHGGNTLEVNAGLGYTISSAIYTLDGMSYNYSAHASADMDGDPYERYTTLGDVRQKVTQGYLNIPIYLQYQYRCTEWLGVYADLGLGFGIKCSGKAGDVTGTAYSYGVYPEYNDLMIDAPYLNDFGETSLETAMVGKAAFKGFQASVIVGAGLEFYVAKPVSIELGIRYNPALTDIYKKGFEIASSGKVDSSTAPLTYTVADGQRMKALSDYALKSKLSPLQLHIGLNFRF